MSFLTPVASCRTALPASWASRRQASYSSRVWATLVRRQGRVADAADALLLPQSLNALLPLADLQVQSGALLAQGVELVAGLGQGLPGLLKLNAEAFGGGDAGGDGVMVTLEQGQFAQSGQGPFVVGDGAFHPALNLVLGGHPLLLGGGEHLLTPVPPVQVRVSCSTCCRVTASAS